MGVLNECLKTNLNTCAPNEDSDQPVHSQDDES